MPDRGNDATADLPAPSAGAADVARSRVRRFAAAALRHALVVLWRVLALAFLALALIGVAVPGLPTVPFLLAAAWAAGHGWPALERRLEQHSRFGPALRRWRVRRAVSRTGKWSATIVMAAGAVVMQFTAAPVWVRIGVPALMLAVAMWLWRRPER